MVWHWQFDKLEETFRLAGVTDESKVLVYSDGRDVLGATMVAYLLVHQNCFQVSEIFRIRNGYIPGAKNISWPTFTVGEENFHQLKLLDEIRQILSDRNVRRDGHWSVTIT
jgi:3-mercaptopyruvate sulfurtransferase SseA